MKQHVLLNLKKVLAAVLAVAMVVTYLPETAFLAKADEDFAETVTEPSEAENLWGGVHELFRR